MMRFNDYKSNEGTYEWWEDYINSREPGLLDKFYESNPGIKDSTDLVTEYIRRKLDELVDDPSLIIPGRDEIEASLRGLKTQVCNLTEENEHLRREVLDLRVIVESMRSELDGAVKFYLDLKDKLRGKKL